MKLLMIIMISASTLGAGIPAFGQDNCKAGERKLDKLDAHTPCIPDKLVNYLVCLEKSSGGKIEFTSKEGSDNSSAQQIILKGKGSGVVVNGEANGSYSTSETARITRELQAKLDPNLTTNCKIFADEITACKSTTDVHSETRFSDWKDTNWDLTKNPMLYLPVNYNERIVGGDVQTQTRGFIATSAVTISPDHRMAQAQCAAQNDGGSNGFCRIRATVDVTDITVSCP
jgi:hypothetical protein